MSFCKDKFIKWVNSDNVVKLNEGRGYREQTTQWKKIFSFSELKQFYIKEYGNQ